MFLTGLAEVFENQPASDFGAPGAPGLILALLLGPFWRSWSWGLQLCDQDASASGGSAGRLVESRLRPDLGVRGRSGAW